MSTSTGQTRPRDRRKPNLTLNLDQSTKLPETTPCNEEQTKQPRYKQHLDQGDPVLVIPGLYIGHVGQATKRRRLAELGITALLNVAAGLLEEEMTSLALDDVAATSCFVAMYLPIEDTSTADISCWFRDACVFIDSVRCYGGSVLLYCRAGISRSAAMCIAYLMYRCHLSLDDAFELLRQRRSVVSPNLNFMRQLAEFENLLTTERTGNVGANWITSGQCDRSVDTDMPNTTLVTSGQCDSVDIDVSQSTLVTSGQCDSVDTDVPNTTLVTPGQCDSVDTDVPNTTLVTSGQRDSVDTDVSQSALETSGQCDRHVDTHAAHLPGDVIVTNVATVSDTVITSGNVWKKSLTPDAVHNNSLPRSQQMSEIFDCDVTAPAKNKPITTELKHDENRNVSLVSVTQQTLTSNVSQSNHSVKQRPSPISMTSQCMTSSLMTAILSPRYFSLSRDDVQATSHHSSGPPSFESLLDMECDRHAPVDALFSAYTTVVVEQAKLIFDFT